jgi:hypothetical protein
MEEVLSTLATGDLVLFNEGGGILEKAVRFGTQSEWNHIGMIVNYGKNGLYIYEARRTAEDNLIDYVTGKPLSCGVRMVPAAARIRWEQNAGDLYKIVARKVFPKLTRANDHMKAFAVSMARKPYEQNIVELFKSGYDGPFGKNKENFSSIFCSELVAAFYKRVGLLPADVAANEYTPADFALGAGVEDHIARNGHLLTDYINIV